MELLCCQMITLLWQPGCFKNEERYFLWFDCLSHLICRNPRFHNRINLAYAFFFHCFDTGKRNTALPITIFAQPAHGCSWVLKDFVGYDISKCAELSLTFHKTLWSLWTVSYCAVMCFIVHRISFSLKIIGKLEMAAIRLIFKNTLFLKWGWCNNDPICSRFKICLGREISDPFHLCLMEIFI